MLQCCTSAITYCNSEGEAVRAALAESLGSQESIILGREGLYPSSKQSK